MYETHFEPKAEVILMDLDRKSLHSESFWMWLIEKTTARLLGNNNFKREGEDEPFISDHSVSEHLQYMIDKYAKGTCLELARQYYFEIVNYKMDEILKEGLGIPFERRHKVLGIEDSSAGVVSIKLAGFFVVVFQAVTLNKLV